MKNSSASHTDYSRYFSLKQKAYLINMSEGRDREHYESLSGIIVNRYQNIIELQIPYATGLELPDASKKIEYKLTTEAFGMGLQMIAELVQVNGHTYQLQLRDNLEIYQRRQTARIETTIKLFHARQNFPLIFYRKEFKRIMDYMKGQGLPPNLKFQDSVVNLSMGGIRLVVEPQEQPSPLSMFFIDLDGKLPPVLAVAETAWQRQEDKQLLCGHRFIHILKSDQERINRYVTAIQKERGLQVSAPKTNWDLLDRMSTDGPEKK